MLGETSPCGKLQSSYLGDLKVKLYSLFKNSLFRKTVFRSVGVLRPQIFTRAREWPSLISAPSTGDGVPLTFFQRGSKIGSNFSISMSITLGVVALRLAWSLMYIFLGACIAEIWEGQKLENLARFWTTFDFDREYLKNQSRHQKLETNLIDNDPSKKNLVNFGPLTKKLQAWMLTHPKSQSFCVC